MDNDDARVARFRETEETATSKRAGLLGIEYFDTRETENTTPLYPDMLSKDEMYKNHIVPLREGDFEHSYFFGVTSATPQSFMQELRNRYDKDTKNVGFVLISNSGYQVLARRYDPAPEVQYGDVKIGAQFSEDSVAEVSKTLETVKSDDILDYLISQASKLNASDIHIENNEDNVRVRFRIDGTLHPIAILTKEKFRILFSAIASVADVSVAAREAQSGHVVKKFTMSDGTKQTLNMRVETVPTAYGQDIVMRLFNFDSNMLNLDQLGFSEDERKVIDDIVAHPRGMVMVVGPTGSGKSTTLYSILNALNTTERKIITLEDPIEYEIPGVTQIPIDTNNEKNTGDGFAEAFRAVLRLDPDVVMVGEIRDNDTAKTAIQASITGHLVLCTFHAEDASSAFARMIDMIGKNPIFSTAVRLVVGQRLVRKLDPATKVEYEPDEATKTWIRQVLVSLPAGIEKPNLFDFKLYKPGTSEENPFGYLGRTVVMEQLVVDKDVQEFLTGDEKDVNADAIKKAAQANGMVTMIQSGVLKALAGETSIEEINRVL
ncbi:MAG: GspE/PulE family protein [Candidatus Nomurabacteria bacterium]|jgi:type II secretory ATPase GspE/PulE/Tfp pilus assembly ATPase PilB-like protein|nr:GspE/PulE family protein [Candidatus Nomurabacteria bacterium]